MGKRMLMARAESKEGSGKWEVGRVDGRKGGCGVVDSDGGVETGRGNLEGGGEGEMGRGAIGMGRGWQWRGGQGEEEMERGGNGEGGEDGKGATGRGERGKRWGWGGGEEGARGGEISQMDMMGCLCGKAIGLFNRQADRMLTTEAIASDSYKHMECLCGMRLQSFLGLPVQRRVPQLVYTNKIGDCLFV